MSRGVRKQQSRQRAQREVSKRNTNGSQIAARAAGLQIKCPNCFISLANYKLLKQHFEAKHPKDTVPLESDYTK